MTIVTDTLARLNAPDTDSRRKFRLEVFTKADGVPWIRACFGCVACYEFQWVPAFHDLFRIVQAIAACEDQRYPPPAHGRGRLAAFLHDCCTIGDWERVAKKYNIPQRDRGQVINANGADLSRRAREEWPV